MAVKIITLDLDGTLMSPDHLTVSQENKDALRAAHEKGVKIAVATGRTLAIMGDVCTQVPQVDYIIHSNGAGVVDRKTGERLYSNLMSWDFCEKIIDFLNTKPCFYELYVDGKSYVQEDRAPYFITDVLPKEFIDALMDRMEVCTDAKAAIFGKDVEKITVYSNDSAAAKELRAYFESMTDKICFDSSLPGDGNMEMTKIGVDKGTALKGMCDVLGIDTSEAMAVGDAGNDVSMLKVAGYSVAMGNGTDEVRATAKYITLTNAESGVAAAVKKFVLGQD